jgi:uncharacterized protein (DUF1810 family)
MEDRFNLQRFVEAQRDEIDGVRAELTRGRKDSHWMWFILPQLRGLGHSGMANHYGISGRAEGEAYLNHPTLGPRLIECTELVNRIEGRTIEEIFGDIDSMKFRSSMTLFSLVDGDKAVFSEALRKYFNGLQDPVTIERLERAGSR